MPDMREQCFWTLDNETWLIQYITTHRAKGGDGLNFDKTFWATVAATMTAQGSLKTSEACQSKWSRIHSTFNIIDRLANYSGLEFRPELGANITDASESVWTELVKSMPQAKQFKNKGWPHYDVVKELLPSKGRGDVAHHATAWPVVPAKDCSCSTTMTGTTVVPNFESEKVLDAIKHPNPHVPPVPDEPPSPIRFIPSEQPMLFTGNSRLPEASAASSTLSSSKTLGKHRAIADDDDSRAMGRPPNSTKMVFSSTSTSKSVKSQCHGISDTFDYMSDEIHGPRLSFDNATSAIQEHMSHMHEHMSHDVAHSVDPVPVCKQRAVVCVQQEESLTDVQMVAVMMHIQADVAIADMYLSIQKDELRRLYLSQYFN
ncbi:uncharacterized protein F5147DRAFT_769735 [Suillus discolor]|uniref:Myb-like domain-containing protein n=1 Tax=Suillus discolor TaxID=1912936 RepID=A0A9P7JY32_9AGAM|nr:uncharacterized protein F5147DRAFT_769735 [Suillus discolor]KAG2115280.1 hypothetical protein F5147DRAFT_769735 [Suillus discolor]